ncbi:DUF6082 family protein [Streptomyces sp. NRRL S-337]|uniref:DUF6082 family protein n=1 Tax=Streptomyces sp. NRRL S-337 TaxID=1463900 RepID=UPI0006900CE2|nr:DUF6082 family protein [Streptomyces sp. NRRL S-337]
MDWNRLSQVGAAHGFTSAIVSALALAGVAASLVVQNRQARADQVQGIRSYYLELVRLELDDMAFYQPVWGATDIADPQEQKRHVYADLMMNYAWMGFEIRTIREPLLRDMLAGMFTGEAGRHYWFGSARSSAEIEQFMTSGSTGPCPEFSRGPRCGELGRDLPSMSGMPADINYGPLPV